MGPVHFDWSVSLGGVIQLLVLLGALVRLANNTLTRITARMQAMERRIDLMWGWIIIQMTKEQREQYDSWIRNHPMTRFEEQA